MVPYLFRRVATGVVLLFLVLTLVFFIVRAVPGDPAELLAAGGLSGDASPEAIEQMRTQLGLDAPLLIQFLRYLGGFVTGDLGTSFEDGRAVTQAVFERLPNTLELVFAASLIGVVAGLVLGSIAALRGGIVDTFVTGFSSLSVSIPVYVLATFLAWYFALTLGWLPAGGYTSWADPPGHLRMLVLPSVALAIPFAAIVARMTRSGLLENLQQDWVRTGRSWGLSPRAVFGRHVFRNSMTAVVTIVGLEIGGMLGATVLVERVFSYPGLSALMIDAVNNRDYPIVQGVVIVIAVFFIVINIVVDVLYGVLDPRARR